MDNSKIKNCLKCGQTFNQSHGNQKYCRKCIKAINSQNLIDYIKKVRDYKASNFEYENIVDTFYPDTPQILKTTQIEE